MSGGSGSPVAPPFVVADGADITFFTSEASLGRYLEPWFPSEVAYRAFDREGRRRELVVASETVARHWLPDTSRERVVVRPLETEPTHAGELARLLVRYLSVLGVPMPEPGASVDDLLRLAMDHGTLDP